MLQSGFHLDGVEGSTIASLLVSVPGFTETYIEEEIHTIFYNGDAIDDMDTRLSGPSATVALAGAMPGLAGAIVRKGSPWGALRKTPEIGGADRTGGHVNVLVKLFNTIAVDRGPELLTTGTRINAHDLHHFLALRPSLLNSFRAVTFNESPVASDELEPLLSSCDQIRLQVHTS